MNSPKIKKVVGIIIELDATTKYFSKSEKKEMPLVHVNALDIENNHLHAVCSPAVVSDTIESLDDKGKPVEKQVEKVAVGDTVLLTVAEQIEGETEYESADGTVQTHGTTGFSLVAVSKVPKSLYDTLRN